MAAIAATSPIGAYQREATRLATASPRVGGKVITSDAGINIGPFSMRYSATDYEFDMSGVTAQTSFSDVLDAAATVQRLAETPTLTEAAPNALTRRQALASYSATASIPIAAASQSMFTATV
jgi:hypothetical protein